jgi:glutamine amidotransferase
MNAIRARGLDDVLDAEVNRSGKPMLGICLGMQLLAMSSTEHGNHTGLGWLNAHVERFALPLTYKVPHIGWNTLKFSPGEPLFRGLKPNELNFYFVHSFHVLCLDHGDVIATCDYGGEFTAAVRRQNVVATQFHPEKSQDNGVRVLQNFVDWNP